jgi:hypothetical protein
VWLDVGRPPRDAPEYDQVLGGAWWPRTAVVATFAAVAPGLPDLHASLHGEVGQGGPLASAGMPD